MDAPGMIHPGPGATDPFDPVDVEDVRLRVVEPVLQWMLRPGELREYEIGWEPSMNPVDPEWSNMPGPVSPEGLPMDLVVRVTTSSSTLEHQLWIHGSWDKETLHHVAERLADDLQDWICEGVRWGEHPGPRQSPFSLVRSMMALPG